MEDAVSCSSRVNKFNIVVCWQIFTEMLHTIFRNWDTSIDNRYIPTCYTKSVENNQNAGDQPELNHGCRVTMGGHCSLPRVTCHHQPHVAGLCLIKPPVANYWSGLILWNIDTTKIIHTLPLNDIIMDTCGWINVCSHKHNQCPLYLSFRSEWGLELELWRIVSTVDQDVDWRG